MNLVIQNYLIVIAHRMFSTFSLHLIIASCCPWFCLTDVRHTCMQTCFDRPSPKSIAPVPPSWILSKLLNVCTGLSHGKIGDCQVGCHKTTCQIVCTIMPCTMSIGQSNGPSTVWSWSTLPVSIRMSIESDQPDSWMSLKPRRKKPKEAISHSEMCVGLA